MAAQLGIVDVERMAAVMSPEQIDGWMAYDAAEPLGTHGLMRQIAKMVTFYMAAHGAESNEANNYPGVRLDRGVE